MNCVIRINEDLNGLKNAQSKKTNEQTKNTLAEFKRPLSSDCNGYGFADENNISIQPRFGKCAGECGN